MSDFNNFNEYIDRELTPAIDWSKTPDAQTFARECPNLAPFITADPKQGIECCYIISLVKNNKKLILYVGEAKRNGRLIVHCHHLAKWPREFFGIDSSEVKYVTIELDKQIFYDPRKRKTHELNLRIDLSPVINPASLGNSCISRQERYEAVHNYFNDPEKLRARIEFVTEKASYMYDFNAFIKEKTPCCDYSKLDIPDGLKTRIREYIRSMPKAARAELIQNLSNNLGEAFFITEDTAVKLLSRILAEDPYDSKEIMKLGLKAQIKQRQELMRLLEDIG